LSSFGAPFRRNPASNLDSPAIRVAVTQRSVHHRGMVVILICLAALVLALLALVTLTAIGESRRGLHVFWSALAGLVFPITWAVWYVRDRRGHLHTGA
jgi:hypothetical protein